MSFWSCHLDLQLSWPHLWPYELGFCPFLDQFIIVFIDNILVYSKSEAELEMHLSCVLQTLSEHRLYAKFSKCEFWLDIVVFLGHVIFADGNFADPQRLRLY